MTQRFAVARGPMGSSRWMLAVPLAWLAVVTLTDLLTPTDIHISPLLVAAPALTALFAGARATGLVAFLALAAQVLAGAARGRTVLESSEHQAQTGALVLVGILLVLYCRARERRLRLLSQVRRVSETAQHLVLRPLPRRIGPLRVASLYLAAEAEARIGGDLYAAARTGDGTRLLIGDVRGKGLPAVGDAALVLGTFRAATHTTSGLADTAALLDETTRWNLGDPDAADQAREIFITALLMDVPDDPDASPSMLVCGHPPPLLLRQDRVVTVEPRDYSPPLGLGGAGYHVETFTCGPGDVLLLYTDGITEARDASGRFYPLREHVTKWTGCGPATLVQRLRDDVQQYAGGSLGDDAALIALCRGDVPEDEETAAAPPR